MKAKTLMISLYLVVVLLFAGQTAAQGSIQLELDQGWNQISGSEPFQISELSEKCRIEEVAGQKVWGFYNGSWQHHDALRPNLGYYVFAEASCTAEVPSVSVDSSLSIGGGWSMISRTGVDYWRECSTTSYEGNVAWRYSGNKWSHISNISSMNPLNGYWVNNKDLCRFKKGFSGSKFVILSDEATEQLDYEFKTSKKPEYIMEGSNKSGEDNDEITKLSEGYLVEGITGAGKGDSYKIPVSANISDFRVLNYPQDRYTLFIDGKKVDPGLYGAEDQDSGKEENYSFAAVKKGSKYEQNVDLPSCETSSSEVKIIDEESDWDAVKSEDYRVYCVEPGNYKDWGTKIIRSSGTSSEPKVFRATNIDNHPANEDSENLPTFSNLYITGSNWIISGIEVNPGPDSDGWQAPSAIRTFPDADNNLIHKVSVNNFSGSGITIQGDDNVIQHSFIGDMHLYGGQVCIKPQGGSEGAAVSNTKIVSNEIRNCGDHIQIIQTPSSPKTSYPGTIIANNDIYNQERFLERCDWQKTSDGEKYIEDFIDIKSAAQSADAEPVKLIGNRFFWTGDPEGCSRMGGTDVVIHQGGFGDDVGTVPSKYVLFEENIFFNSPNRIALGQDVEHLSFVDNIFSTGRERAWQLGGSHKGEFYGNILMPNEGTKWFHTIYSNSGWDFQCNVVLDNSNTNLGDISSLNADYNAYYGGAERIERPGTNDIVRSEGKADMGEICLEAKRVTGTKEYCIKGVKTTSSSPHENICQGKIQGKSDRGVNDKVWNLTLTQSRK